MLRARHITVLLLLIFSVSLTSCRTYYAKNRKFNEYFQAGQLEKAQELLESDTKSPKKNSRLLYYLNRGVVAHMLGDYKASNTHFEEALLTAEAIEKNYAREVAAVITNRNVLPYKGEDFELLMVHYYKALNYLYQKEYTAALVECRRMNIKLQALSDKYKGENKFKNDAFIHNLMGIIYEADHDYNNAFIAYRNAYNYYESDYAKLFSINPPEQLKKDILRAAYRTGFHSEVAYYEKKFNTQFNKDENAGDGELVFFWLNGLSPVKDEWSVNFTVLREDDLLTFINYDLGWVFQFPYDRKDSTMGLGQVEMVRMALPKYVERPLVYTSASIKANGQTKQLELAEDINKIAFESLNDRLMKELGQSLMRLAAKKAAEYAVRDQNENIGAVLGIVNFVTEQADTRNWQTLPHSIYYTRMSLPQGEQKVEISQRQNSGRTDTESFSVTIKPGQTTFRSLHALASQPGFYSINGSW